MRSLFHLFSALPRAVFRVRARRRRRRHDYAVRGRFFLVGAALAISVFLIHTFTRSPITAPANAVAGTATFSGTESSLTGDITAGRLVDQANSSYYIDPAASGNSLITAGAASVSGNLVLNAGATIGTTNMQPLTLGSATTGLTKVTSAGKLQLQAGGTGTGSTGTGSIYFLNSSGASAGRFDTSGASAVNATGGTITYSGGYKIHTFTSSGTFTPSGSGDVEYLIVGGGGTGNAGGGGAGGFRTGTSSVTAQAYTVTVGAGGVYAGGPGVNGGSSSFNSISAAGGGGGNVDAGGGSGGGGQRSSSVSARTGRPGNVPSVSPSQGNNGGDGVANDNTGSGGGGGGGVGAVGGNASGTTGGNGGAGTASSISGSSVTYAGGGGGGGSGGGGAGGAGGGGNGGSTSSTAGAANTGGGGGAWYASDGSAGASNGGSGIVIIRYKQYGDLYLGSNNTSSEDLAEYYVAGDNSIEAGDVVTIEPTRIILGSDATPESDSGQARMTDTKGRLYKATKAYDRSLIGIISTNPGVLMGSVDGENKEDKRMLALAGRVPVKIDPDSPAIAVGDFLTSSTKPGFATKATRPGYVVARALEAWSPGGTDRIEAFIQLTYYMGDIDERGDFRSLEVDTLKANKTLEVGGVNVMDEINNLKRRLDALEKR